MSQRTGVSARLLRYNEEQGLVRPDRTPSDQRVYSIESVHRVALIRRLLAAGLGTERIGDVLPCFDAPPRERTGYLVSSLHAERARIDATIESLASVRAALDEVIESALIEESGATRSNAPS
jgi:DNA-binding transcriptional MerR regulator